MKPPIYIHIYIYWWVICPLKLISIDDHHISQRFPNWKLPINSSIVHNLHIFPIYFPYISHIFLQMSHGFPIHQILFVTLASGHAASGSASRCVSFVEKWRIDTPTRGNPWKIIWKIEKNLGKTWKTMEHMDNNGKILGKNLGKY